ncbi:MAG TPA: CAP domain-containing protein [Solirubrobacteraceae bacterium]|nr:CAP domain-containing protein [Solirubrobacteraceae bacterium]
MLVTGLLAIVALALVGPAGAEARTACPAEQAAPTAGNSAAVSDAIFCLTNQIRASYGLPAFHRDTRLDTAARLHSEDMAARNYFAHTNPEGLDPSARAALQGYTYGVGENIAAGYRDARAVMIGWMASKGHCGNILSTARDIGVGTAATPRTNYTQDFGNYNFATSNAVAAGCPYNVNLDTLATPDPPPPLLPVLGGPTATAADPAQQSLANDTPAPPALVLGRLGLSRTRLAPGRGSTVVSYTLSAAADVTFRVQRVAGDGRWRTLRASLVAQGASGENTFRLRARLNGHALGRGSYRLVAVATDDTGAESATRRARFRVGGRV